MDRGDEPSRAGLVERVARAMILARHPNCPPGKGRDPYVHELAEARAAIEAMREPTEEMLDACAARMKGMTFSDHPRKQDAALYRAMIDAALQEEPGDE